MASEQRQLWGVLEPYHAMVYFAPEAMENYRAAGLKGFWMGYFASRSAAFGAASPELVIATFYNFNPAMVRRAIPDAWTFASPQSVLDARHRGADACLARLLGDAVDDGILEEAAGIARDAALACDPAGRPLFAAHATLPWPDAPRMALWHAATLLREHRADGHIAALLAEGVNGVQAHILQVARRRMPREIIEMARGWNDATWDVETESLRARGWIDTTCGLTDEGKAAHRAIDANTDRAAAQPWAVVGEERSARLRTLMAPVAQRILDQGGIGVPNPIGLDRRA